MTETVWKPKDDDDKRITKMFLASVSLHFTIFAVFGLRVLLFPSTDPILYQSSVRVDLVALPEKSLSQALPEPQPVAEATKKPPEKVAEPVKPEPKIKTPDPTKVDLKNKQNKALDQLKALKSLQDEMNKKKESEKVAKPIKGNVLAAGTSLKGLNQHDYLTYIGDIDASIKRNWELPEWLANSNLKAKVLVKIDERGYVVKKEMIQSSNNPTYDSLVIQAIDKSSPFPAPPEKFVNIVGIDGIIFQFPE